MTKHKEGGFLISKIRQISDRVLDKKLKDAGIEDLNSAQGRIVFSLWNKDNATITELAKRTALGKTTLTAMLDRLEKLGHVNLEPDIKDKRVTRVSLSDKMKSRESLYHSISTAMVGLFYKGFAESEIDDFEGCLRRVLANLVEYESHQE